MGRAALFAAFALIALPANAPNPGTAWRAPGSATQCCTATIRVHVPEGTGTVYLAGSLPQVGNWRPDGLALSGTGRERTVQVSATPGTAFEYKFTLGDWDHEAQNADGSTPGNNRLLLDRDTTVVHAISRFKQGAVDYLADWQNSGVLGRLVIWKDVPSQFLGPTRNVEVWLPPGYDESGSTRYPVLYMHDGQNLFDPRLSFTGVDWGVDESVVRLAQRGVIPPVIIVGAWSTADRWKEYSPWHGASDYARFLIEELMPRINREFRTLTGPANTATMGSSMGGLLSFYLVTHHPEVFGACGCESTHFPLSEAVAAKVFSGFKPAGIPDTTPYVVKDIAAGLRAPAGARYRFDYGSLGLDSAYTPTHEVVRAWLLRQGKVEGQDFVIRRYEGATHNEASWRARMDDELTFLFGKHQATPSLAVPAWSKDVTWYQIFVERFRNGDPGNDPTPHDMIGVTNDSTPAGWRVTPWTHDWYQQEPWARATGRDFYGTVQSRRYGGDLQGVMDELDYLQRLGVTALFLNPINDAPSLHKYDARSYQHIDRNFGPDPRGDEAMMAAEDPANPATWRWTAADSLFLALVKEVHRRGMRIIMDYSWNHTGIAFWAWRDILKNQRASRFADWYQIERFDDPATPDTNEFSYKGWAGVPWLPEWRKVGRPEGKTAGAIEGNLVPPVKDLVFSVTRRWLDPNGDGDPSDGVDGFRLDVADVIPLGFWRDYRQFVRSINPDAYLVGEIWWEKWPDKLYDPAPWLQGDVFDAVMNYRWFTPTRSFFAGAPPRLTASQYVQYLDSLNLGIGLESQRAMMNLTASHDTPRFGTSIYNPGRYKYHNRPTEDSTYRINRPDRKTRQIQALILVQQFTYIGAPEIWNGDEVGMWGADDPDERKPMVWGDLRYDDETADPLGRPRRRDHVVPDTGLFRVYRDLIAMRKQHLRLLVDGSLKWLRTDDARGVLIYERVLGDQRAIVAFNNSDAPHVISVAASGRYRAAFPASGVIATSGTLRALLPARTARVWIRE
ncbi:MAG TPA: alpha-amylase family glycosyl hydrolase [Gemmatimonadales bacterium]|jgi:glycosidase|nr:alpha-amylase family glycosyl hydrolase [Gemmatimonadales bacterium]